MGCFLTKSSCSLFSVSLYSYSCALLPITRLSRNCHKSCHAPWNCHESCHAAQPRLEDDRQRALGDPRMQGQALACIFIRQCYQDVKTGTYKNFLNNCHTGSIAYLPVCCNEHWCSWGSADLREVRVSQLEERMAARWPIRARIQPASAGS